MDWGQALQMAVPVLAAISGMVLGWTAKAREARRELQAEAGADAALRADMEYIKRGVDDIRADQRSQGQRIDDLTQRVTRVEESAKSAHKRLDRLDGAERGADD